MPSISVFWIPRLCLPGIELFPQKDFWSGLPGLVFDGMRFSFGKFRVATGIVSAASNYENL